VAMLEGVNLVNIVSFLIGIGLVSTVVWKYYNEFKK